MGGGANPQIVPIQEQKISFDWRGFIFKGSRTFSFDVVELSQIKVPYYVYALFFSLGCAPWLLVNAIFLQLPFLIELPQGDSIAAMISLSVQTANCLVPLYLYLRRKSFLDVRKVIFGLLLLAFCSSLGYSAAWKFAKLDANSTFIALIILSGLAGATGCLSNVSFWEFVAAYHPNLITAVAVGNAFSSIIPSAVAAIQNPGPNSKFNFSLYFVLNGIFLLLCILCYLCILFLPRVEELKRENWADETRKLLRPLVLNKGSLSTLRSESVLTNATTTTTTEEEPDLISGRNPNVQNGKQALVEPLMVTNSTALAATTPNSSQRSTSGSEDPTVLISPGHYSAFHAQYHTQDPDSDTETQNEEQNPVIVPSRHTPTYGSSHSGSSRFSSMASKRSMAISPTYVLPEPSSKNLRSRKELLIMFWISFVVYFIPGLITFLVRGFEDSDFILLVIVISGMVGGTVGRLLSAYFNRVWHTLLLITQLICSIILVLGQPLKWAPAVGWVMVVAYFFLSFQFGFQSTMLFKGASMSLDTKYAQKLCRWLGAVEQLGALLGALVAFSLVIGDVFH